VRPVGADVPKLKNAPGHDPKGCGPAALSAEKYPGCGICYAALEPVSGAWRQLEPGKAKGGLFLYADDPRFSCWIRDQVCY